MSVTIYFGEYQGPENLQGPFDKLVLEGGALRDGNGIMIAEMFEDREHRRWWKPFMGQNIYNSISIHGMGNRP